MIKPHPLSPARVVNNAHPDTWRPYAKFQPNWSFNQLLIAKQLPVGVANVKPYLYVVNNAYPST